MFLKNVPVDAVCLDTRFIDGIETSGRDRDILAYLTSMAATCVEHINIKGVANGEQKDIVKEFAITTMQGAYVSVPVSCEQILNGMQ